MLRPLDTAHLMAVLLSHSRKNPHWQQLFDFLLDPHVSADAKRGALRYVGAPGVGLPQEVAARLRTESPRILAEFNPIGPADSVLEAIGLRLWIKIGSIDADETTDRLLRVASDSSAETRREAAGTVALAQRRIGDDAAFTLSLLQTRDPDYLVRTGAAESLAILDRSRARSLGILATERLHELLLDGGNVVPLGALGGLTVAAELGRATEASTERLVDQVRRSHPSRRVCSAAQELLELLHDR